MSRHAAPKRQSRRLLRPAPPPAAEHNGAVAPEEHEPLNGHANGKVNGKNGHVPPKPTYISGTAYRPAADATAEAAAAAAAAANGDVRPFVPDEYSASVEAPPEPKPEPPPEPEPEPRKAIRAALPLAERRWRGSHISTQIWVLTARSLRGAFGDMKLVFFGLLQPVVMLLLFSQVFKNVGTLAGVAAYHGYINFLMPATLVNIAMTTAMSSGVGLAAEIYTGFVGRLRAMPISLFSVLVARTLADGVRLAVQLVVVALAAIAFLGFRPHDFAGASEALGLSVLVGWGVGWLFVAIATWQKKAEVMQAVSFIVMFPLMFGSSAYMPVAVMPGWLRAVSKVNPLTYAIDASRRLTVGASVGSKLNTTLLLIAATTVLGAFAAARNFRRTKPR